MSGEDKMVFCVVLAELSAERLSMLRRYVNQLGHQDIVDQVFVVAEKQLRPNRNGNLYLQMELSDRTGKIGARMWNASEVIYKAFENGDYVRAKARRNCSRRRAIDRHPAHQGFPQ